MLHAHVKNYGKLCNFNTQNGKNILPLKAKNLILYINEAIQKQKKFMLQVLLLDKDIKFKKLGFRNLGWRKSNLSL